MCSLTVFHNLLTPTRGQPSGLELLYQFGSLANLLDTLLVQGPPELERDGNWVLQLRQSALDRVATLSEPSRFDNAAYRRECKADLRGLKSTVRDLFARSHRAYHLNPLLRDVANLAYGQRLAATAGDPYVFSRAGYDASHFTALHEYGDALDLLTPFLRAGCFALASFNRLNPTTGLPLDWLHLATALERLPGFEAPPFHSSLVFGPQPSSPQDVELVTDLRLVCDVLGLEFGSVSHQLVTYAVVQQGFSLGNSPSRALRTADFRVLANHTSASLRLLQQFQIAQQSPGNAQQPVGNEVARAVVRTQVTWFERLWQDEHGSLRFSISQLGRDVQLRVRDGLRTQWGRTVPLFDGTEQVWRVDETQDESWIAWLRDSEFLETRSFYEDGDGSSDTDGGDDGDDNNLGDSLRPRPVQATTRFPRGRRNAVVQVPDGLSQPSSPTLTRQPPPLTQEERLERGLLVGTGLFVSAEHFIYSRMVNQLLASMRDLRANPNPDRALLLNAETRSRILGRVAGLEELDFPYPSFCWHPLQSFLWDTLRAFFAHAMLAPQPIGPSLQRELERLSDLLVAGWEEPDLLPEFFAEGSSAVDLADDVAVLQWLLALLASTDHLDTSLLQAQELSLLFAEQEANVARVAAADEESGYTADERSLHRWRLLDLPAWVEFLRSYAANLSDSDEQVRRERARQQEFEELERQQQLLEDAYRDRQVFRDATREQHAALLSALPRSFHPSVNFLHPDTLTHANANPQYGFLLDTLSALAREEEELRTWDPLSTMDADRLSVVVTQRRAYGTAVLDIVQAEASRAEAPEFGPVTAAESVPSFFALPGLGADGLLPFTSLAVPHLATVEDEDEDVDMPDWGDADGYFFQGE